MATNITFSTNLYVGKSISARKLDKIKIKLINKPLMCGASIISLSKNDHDQLDIMSARQLAQKYYSNAEMKVVGIACNHDEAVELVEDMLKECLKDRGDCLIKEYLLCGFSS